MCNDSAGSRCCQVDSASFGALEGLLSHQLFQALGEPNRIRLLLLLVERCRTCTVSELARCLTVDVSVVSRHLALLRAAGVLRAVRRGRHVHYAIQYDHLAETLRGIADAIDACRPAADPGPSPDDGDPGDRAAATPRSHLSTSRPGKENTP